MVRNKVKKFISVVFVLFLAIVLSVPFMRIAQSKISGSVSRVNSQPINFTRDIFIEKVTEKSKPDIYYLDSEQGASFSSYYELHFTNQEDKSIKSFSLRNLIAESILEPYRESPYELKFRLRVIPLKWDEEHSNFYGIIGVIPGADPPAIDAASIFKINSQNWTVQTYAIPDLNYISDPNSFSLNIETNTILLEVVTESNGLFLYSYDYVNEHLALIRHYKNDLFSLYIPGKFGFINYLYPEFANIEPRFLKAKWTAEGIQYTDFVTREPVKVIIQ